MSKEFALEFSAVGKSYGRVKALNCIDLRIRDGEFVGLLGPNGSGKSTLFQIASGLFAPDSGTVTAFGRSFAREPSQILRRMGVVFQSRSIDLDMSVAANLKFHGALFGLSGAALNERIARVLKMMGIEEFSSRLVRQLSGGNQRRVEIARALLNQPQLLLMDEPSVGLDPETRRVLNAHIIELHRAESVSVVWATHIVEEVKDADRIVLIVQGNIVADGTPAQICEQAGKPSLEEAYLALSEVVVAA